MTRYWKENMNQYKAYLNKHTFRYYFCKFVLENVKRKSMIEVKEKAGIYAEENVINVLKEAFAKVYADGYHDGYKDREEMIPVDLRDSKTEFVDLGLPSGTLWAKDFEMEDNKLVYAPYIETQRIDIPTKVQCAELLVLCKFKLTGGSVHCIGPNGKSIVFSFTGFKEIGNEEKSTAYSVSYFWIKDEDHDSKHNAAFFYLGQGTQVLTKTGEIFSGYKLPIRLVKKNSSYKK